MDGPMTVNETFGVLESGGFDSGSGCANRVDLVYGRT